jgi:Transglycosylase-like domain/LysM domain
VNAINAGRSPLGAHTSTAFSRLARRVPVVAAAPALLGVAAAVVMANAPSGHSAGPQLHPGSGTAALGGAAAVDALSASQPSTTPASAPAAAPASAPAAAPASSPAASPATRTTAPAGKHAKSGKYTVQSGDTLAAVAQQLYHSDRYWPVLYWANHQQVKFANELTVGQVLIVPAKPAKIPAPPSALGPAPAPSAPASTSQAAGTSQAAPSGGSTQAAVTTTTVSTSGYSSFQACVISRESGGNPQVMNGSGHYGLYQFSESTWVAYGGAAGDFGHASVAEQNQVFASAMAAGGESNWAPYDGC